MKRTEGCLLSQRLQGVMQWKIKQFSSTGYEISMAIDMSLKRTAINIQVVLDTITKKDAFQIICSTKAWWFYKDLAASHFVHVSSNKVPKLVKSQTYVSSAHLCHSSEIQFTQYSRIIEQDNGSSLALVQFCLNRDKIWLLLHVQIRELIANFLVFFNFTRVGNFLV